MKDISVEELAKIVGTPEDKILSQMKEAGLNQTSASDLVTDQDKKILLDLLLWNTKVVGREAFVIQLKKL